MKKDDSIEIATKLRQFWPHFGMKLVRPHELRVPRHVPTQMLALYVLNNGRSLKMTELASEIQNSNQYTTLIVDKLIKDNLVKRVNDENDRRITRIVITEAGKKFLKDYEDEILDDLVDRLDTMELGDVEAVKDAFDKVIRLIELLPRQK